MLVARLHQLYYPNEDGEPTFEAFVVRLLGSAVEELLDIEPIELNGTLLRIVTDPTMPVDEAKLVGDDGKVVHMRFTEKGEVKDEEGRTYELDRSEPAQVIKLVPKPPSS